MNKVQEHLANEEFTPGEVWAFWFCFIAFSGIFLFLGLHEMGLAWGWGYSIMALCGGTGVAIADLKEEAQEGYLERKQISRQKEALAKIDGELNESD